MAGALNWSLRIRANSMAAARDCVSQLQGQIQPVGPTAVGPSQFVVYYTATQPVTLEYIQGRIDPGRLLGLAPDEDDPNEDD